MLNEEHVVYLGRAKPGHRDSSCVHAQLCRTLCDPMDYHLPGSTVHRISQARIQSFLPFPIPGNLPHPRIEPGSPVSPALTGSFFTTAPPGKMQYSVTNCILSC